MSGGYSRAKRKNIRIAMASQILSPEYMSADCLVTVQADARYSTAVLNPAWSIHQIVRETLSDSLGAVKQQRIVTANSPRSIVKGTTRLDIFNTLFKRRRERLVEVGYVIAEDELCDIYVGALNIELFNFNLFKLGYYTNSDDFPDNLNGMILYADQFFARQCPEDP